MKIDIVNADDWSGLYLDGVLVEEGHHLRLKDVLAACNLLAEFHEVNQAWMEKQQTLPAEFAHVETV